MLIQKHVLAKSQSLMYYSTAMRGCKTSTRNPKNHNSQSLSIENKDVQSRHHEPSKDLHLVNTHHLIRCPT